MWPRGLLLVSGLRLAGIGGFCATFGHGKGCLAFRAAGWGLGFRV